MTYPVKSIFALLVGAVILPSCVSNKKFNESQASLAAMRKRASELQDDLSNAKSRLRLMEEANESAANQLDEKDKRISANQQELADQQERLRQLQELIDRQKAQTEALRGKMAQALGNFTSDQLSVFTKNGKVYVSLSEKLLFPSGSAVVNQEGKEALQKVAEALNENRDINVNIEGHTDTVPIRIKFEDNWALSVARSTAIVRLLTTTYQLDPTRITASGRSQYEPVADNSTPEGRAKNRRTEIILAPKLDELMQLIDDSKSK
ncbi:OmpA family protein [Taibaiella chishuiensis]|uniref:Chemotaxis protein MotB n=1 Tax=Taibaiella chishuiensis TaxID=1434707 RepID=A0A2P8DB17_9BACT|nr:OmpA family protein [Taibaiella chishuiensis]PSK94412.1 chemotaxis protein MotB [Taibaiella chishuiensis]